ncbi:MAG: hypothetical protein ACRDP4_05955 [Nocardioidaceae bacterium]
MRRAVGWLLLVVGVGCCIVGVVAAIAFGPDDTVSSGPHGFSSKGAAIITAPTAIAYSGPTVELTASTPSPTKPVFVGVAYDVDVRDYLAGASYTRVETISVPWDTTQQQVAGDATSKRGPRGLDWWLVSSAGNGSATVTFPLPEAPVDIVVMDPDRAQGFRTHITVKVVQDGIFVVALAAIVGGLGACGAGWILARIRARAQS